MEASSPHADSQSKHAVGTSIERRSTLAGQAAESSLTQSSQTHSGPRSVTRALRPEAGTNRAEIVSAEIDLGSDILGSD